jgi:hypothetical protein
MRLWHRWLQDDRDELDIHRKVEALKDTLGLAAREIYLIELAGEVEGRICLMPQDGKPSEVVLLTEIRHILKITCLCEALKPSGPKARHIGPVWRWRAISGRIVGSRGMARPESPAVPVTLDNRGVITRSASGTGKGGS